MRSPCCVFWALDGPDSQADPDRIGLLGLLSIALGAALGTVLSLVLIYVINKQSFGWTIQFHWPVGLLLAALTGVYLASVAAGLYPARLAARLNPIEAAHEE